MKNITPPWHPISAQRCKRLVLEKILEVQNFGSLKQREYNTSLLFAWIHFEETLDDILLAWRVNFVPMTNSIVGKVFALIFWKCCTLFKFHVLFGLFTFCVKRARAIYFLVNLDLKFSLFVIKDGKIFSRPREQISYANVARELRAEWNVFHPASRTFSYGTYTLYRLSCVMNYVHHHSDWSWPDSVFRKVIARRFFGGLLSILFLSLIITRNMPQSCL